MLIGDKTILRSLERQDLQIVANWRNHPTIRSSFFSAYPIVISCQDKWYDGYLSRGNSLIFMICLHETNQPVGMVGLDCIDHRNQSAEYGRMLIAEAQFRGQGYAKDATITLLRYAFEDLNLNRIYLKVYEKNNNAISLYERCGFSKEGIEREAVFMGGRHHNVLLMSFLRSEFSFGAKQKLPLYAL